MRETVESLLLNDLAADSDLIIFSDASKDLDNDHNVRAVRQYIASIRGFKSITIVNRDRNWGLAANIIDGVTRICNELGRVIVLEDDLVSSRYFLRFMNDALNFYSDDDKVCHISASTYPIDDAGLEETFFLRIPLCWGWGTWKRSWELFSKHNAIMDRFDQKMIKRLNFDGTYPFWDQIKLNRAGRINTWFIYWYAALFLNDSLALFPRKPLVQNIGHDGSGVHCNQSADYSVDLTVDPIPIRPVPICESRAAFDRHKVFFRGLKPSLPVRIHRRLKRFIAESK